MFKKIIFLGVLILIGITGRLLPHPWNTTPVTAIVLFSSVYLSIRYSMAALIIIMLASDIILGFYDFKIMLAVYLSFGFSLLIGWFVKQNKNVGTLIFGSLSASLFFFLITNYAVWQFGSMYEHTFFGLMQSYTMALPFFKNALVGDLIYTGLFFGVYEAVKSIIERAKDAKLQSHI